MSSLSAASTTAVSLCSNASTCSTGSFPRDNSETLLGSSNGPSFSADDAFSCLSFESDYVSFPPLKTSLPLNPVHTLNCLTLQVSDAFFDSQFLQLPVLKTLKITASSQLKKVANFTSSYFPNLVELIISNTGLTTFADSLELPQLEILDLSDNKLSELPNLDYLPVLEILLLSGNQITSLEGFSSLQCLTHLCINDNEVEEIPRSVVSLPSLRNLYATNNRIQKITKFPLTSPLNELYLDKNRLLEVECIEELQNLRYLSVSDNLLSDFNNIVKVTSLLQLNLSKNGIACIPQEFQLLENLHLVNLAGNIIMQNSCDFSLMSNLEIILINDFTNYGVVMLD